MDIISLFSGCGGLDLGFTKAGFNVVWANDNAPSVKETYEYNHPKTKFIKKSIKKISLNEIPDDIIGIIGGPPCQSWSVAGQAKGLKDPRGQLFFEYIRILRGKHPMFFVAENVPGMLLNKHKNELDRLKRYFRNSGYSLVVIRLMATDYGVPQKRERIFFVGYRKDLGIKFRKPQKIKNDTPTVKDVLYDLNGSALPSLSENKSNDDKCQIPNHEYWIGGYSYIFMSRNRVLDWNKPAYTIQAEGRQASIHPQAPKMVKVKKDVMRFVPGKENLYRRLSIRECAKIQTFPNSFIFKYKTLSSGYKMVGNAVPVQLAYHLASKIYEDLNNLNIINIQSDKCELNTVSIQQSSVHV